MQLWRHILTNLLKAYKVIEYLQNRMFQNTAPINYPGHKETSNHYNHKPNQINKLGSDLSHNKVNINMIKIQSHSSICIEKSKPHNPIQKTN